MTTTMKKILCLFFVFCGIEALAQRKHLYPVKKEYEQRPALNYEHIKKAQPFQFGYSIKDMKGNSQWHKEVSDEQNYRKGSYGYTDAYGIYRHVDYIADHLGFRAKVRTNEPGTASVHPADVYIHAENPPQYSSHSKSINSYHSTPDYQQYSKPTERYSTSKISPLQQKYSGHTEDYHSSSSYPLQYSKPTERYSSSKKPSLHPNYTRYSEERHSSSPYPLQDSSYTKASSSYQSEIPQVYTEQVSTNNNNEFATFVLIPPEGINSENLYRN